VTGGSPLITVSLYRLFQALALRITLGADDETVARKRWLSAWSDGRFDRETVTRYFDTWQDEKTRFDLLHEERPFYQHPEPKTKTVKPPTQLFAGTASGNNPTIFDHSVDADATAISLAEAARGVVATQATALGGGRSNPFYYSDAPLVTGAVFWIRGSSLFEALLLNTPFSFEARLRPDGTPLWEREAPPREQPEPSKRHDEGYLDYLTWPSRLLHLQTERHEGVPVVTGVKMSQGDKRLPEGSERDPLMAAAWSKNAGTFPLKLRADRALWRDASAFMNVFQNKAGEAPKPLQWVASQSRVHQKVWWTDVFGLVNDQAKIERWEHARMPIFSTILEEKKLQHQLQEALDRAETQAYGAGGVQYAMRECAAQVLFPGRSYNDLGKQGREEARDAADALDATGRFWTRLEPARGEIGRAHV